MKYNMESINEIFTRSNTHFLHIWAFYIVFYPIISLAVKSLNIYGTKLRLLCSIPTRTPDSKYHVTAMYLLLFIILFDLQTMSFLDGLVARIRRSHRRGRGSIPRQGITFCFYYCALKCV
jgi:hypothetical protein